MSTEENPPFQLEFEEASNTLFGVVNDLPKDAPTPNVTGFHIQNLIKELDYQDFLISPLNQNAFLKNIKNKKSGRYILGEKRDAKVDILIASDRLTATLKITKAWGGKKLANAKIVEAIRHNKIAQECILISELKKVAASHDDDMEVVIAKGQVPVAGRPAELLSLIHSQVQKGHDAESSDAIDQREMFDFAVVEVGQALLKKIPATPGTPGKDVLGKLIPSQAGKDIIFTAPFEGVEFASDDQNVLVAAIKGHPVYSKTGVKVDPVLHLESVNIHSGNIDYDGSVFVKENIESGFIVKASGDIHVKGQVEKANLIAKGNIIIGCGILGEEEEDGKLKARLSCEGDLHARFINLAFIHCGGTINVDEYIMQSRISAKGDILVGQQKGRGRIIGGFCSSEGNIKAKFLGSDAYIPTSLVLGSEESDHPDVQRLNADLERRSNELVQLKSILETIQSRKKPSTVGTIQLDKVKKIHNTIMALEEQITQAEAKLTEFEDSNQNQEKFKVHVSGTIYPNVSISICGQGWHCEEEMRRLTFFRNRKRVENVALES